MSPAGPPTSVSGRCRPRTGGRSFTLVELVLSVAVVLVLLVGVHQVFKLTGETVGAGQALGSAVRDYRAAQSVLYGDLATAVMPYAVGASTLEDGPFFLIRSERLTMFRNRADQGADRDGDPATLDFDGNNVEGDAGVAGEVVRITDVTGRGHRLDRLMFFGRGQFPRLTGGDLTPGGGGRFTSDMSSDEAFIWYGHLQLPDRSTPSGDARRFVGRRPGEVVPPASLAGPQPGNADNFYAADWILGRIAILLVHGADMNDDDIGDVLADRRGVAQVYLRRGGGNATFLAPLHAHFRDRRVRSSEPGGVWELEWSRYDLANTSITQYRQILNEYSARGAAIPWHEWFEGMRFEADPRPDRPLTAAGSARTVPVLLPHCCSFLVEYAGDFVTQDADPIRGAATPTEDGTVLRAVPDGTLDFVRLPDGSRQTRWYGLPRDLDGDGVVAGGRSHNNEMPDVVPLRDVRRTALARPPVDAAPFERLTEHLGAAMRERLPLPAGGDYARSMAPDASYVAAWGPDTVAEPRPRLLRIVFSLDDPQGKLTAPQTYTYVARLP